MALFCVWPVWEVHLKGTQTCLVINGEFRRTDHVWMKLETSLSGISTSFNALTPDTSLLVLVGSRTVFPSWGPGYFESSAGR